MILTEFKPLEELMEKLEGEKKIFIMGCGGCPEGADTGGKEVLADFKKKLEKGGKTVTGVMEIDFLCQKALIRSRIKPKASELKNSDSVLIFSCGIGIQATSAVIDKICHPALNTTTFGGITGMWQVSGRSNVRYPERAFLDLDYVGANSIVSDLGIIAKTVPSVFKGKGAF